MAYNRSPLPRQSSPALKNELLIAVGGHAFIDLPHSDTRPLRSVPMRDEGGQPVDNDLIEGQEVEILAWRPQAREGLAYQVRRLIDGREWWMLARYLRKSRLPVKPVEAKR